MRPTYREWRTAISQPIPDIALTRNDGSADSLARHRGKVLLIVNTASQCGLTPQYAQLEELRHKYRERGFEILAFPANDFAAQEPGSDEEIAQFCQINYRTSFPLFQKASVTGEDKQPLYRALIEATPDKRGDSETMRERLRGHGITPTEDPEVLWNFEKFLIGRDGTVAARFASEITPVDPELVREIERALGD